MKKMIFTLCFVSLFSNALHAQSPFPKEYCGEQVVKKEGQNFTTDVCVDGAKTRLEMTIEGRQSIVIVRPDKKSVYNIMPQEKMVMISPFRSEDAIALESYDKNTSREFIATETLHGQEHDKYKMKTPGADMYLWLKKDTNFPAQIESLDGSMQVQWRKVRLEKPEASLFEIPAGYQVIKTTEEVSVEKP